MTEIETLREIEKIREKQNTKEHRALGVSVEKLEKTIEVKFEKIEKQMVFRGEFRPVKAIAYGLVGITVVYVLKIVLTGAVISAQMITGLI